MFLFLFTLEKSIIHVRRNRLHHKPILTSQQYFQKYFKYQILRTYPRRLYRVNLKIIMVSLSLKVYSEYCHTCNMKLFMTQKTPSEMFEKALNTPMSFSVKQRQLLLLSIFSFLSITVLRYTQPVETPSKLCVLCSYMTSQTSYERLAYVQFRSYLQ